MTRQAGGQPLTTNPAATAERWLPPAGLATAVVQGILASMTSPRDRLLLTTLWATGSRLTDVLALCPRDVRNTGLVMPNPAQPDSPRRLVKVAPPHAHLPNELRRWAREHQLADDEPLFFSRERGADGRRKAIDPVRARQILRAATTRAPVRDAPAATPPAQGSTAAVDAGRLVNVGLPPVRARLVVRPRMVEQLNGVSRRAVTLVAAPAGFGKTTSLATWAAQVESWLPVAWLSLGVGDDDPVRFWRGVVTALQVQRPTIGVSALAHLQAGAPVGLVVDDLLGDLVGVQEHSALVLDDYHLIESSEVHAGVGVILSQCPPFFHLIISTRADPPLPLARLRANGQILEVRAAELQFSADEASRLVGDVLGAALSAEQVALLEARTEGWAAGLHLAALALRSRPDLEAALTAFAGSERNIVDYFVEEVLDRLPEEVRLFLQRTSILEQLHPSLCDAVVGAPGSAALLEALERSSVFITPVDQSRQAFRYHQLFADALRHCLQRDEAMLVPVLHERASEWYAAHGLPEPALEHALAGGWWDRAAGLLLRLFRRLLSQGEELTLRRWLLAVPEAVSTRHPLLGRAKAVALLMSGDMARLDTFLAAAEAAGEPRVLVGVLSIRAMRLGVLAQMSAQSDHLAALLACCERVLRQPLAPTDVRVEAYSELIHYHLLRGDTAAAAPVLEQMRALASRESLLMYWQQMQLQAQQLHQAGDLRQAAAGYRRLLDETGERTVFARKQAWLGLAVIALQWNRLDEALAYLERIDLDERLSGRSHQAIEVGAPVVHARVSRARGHLRAAGEALDAAEHAARVRASPLWARVARAERAALALRDARLADVERWADELDRMDLDAYAREPEALMLCRARRAQGDARQVVPLLEHLLTSAEQVGRTDSVIAILVQLGLAREQVGDSTEALELLERAVRLAEPAGYMRVFVDEGEPMLNALRRLLRRGVSRAYTERLLRAFGADSQRPAALGELLTPRERQVLHLLAQALPNRVIAERLVTSEATIKSHVHNLIGKLGAANRAEVLVRARALGELEAVSSRDRATGTLDTRPV